MTDPDAQGAPTRATSHEPLAGSVAADCDHWRTQAQTAWQRIAELEYLLRVERGLRHVPPIKEGSA